MMMKDETCKEGARRCSKYPCAKHPALALLHAQQFFNFGELAFGL